MFSIYIKFYVFDTDIYIGKMYKFFNIINIAFCYLINTIIVT